MEFDQSVGMVWDLLQWIRSTRQMLRGMVSENVLSIAAVWNQDTMHIQITNE